ncbi:MAG: glycosyltransferase [Bacteroidia bacterium]|nr:glycosyltransferase [Bacteroidia bacterium]MBT8268847.1 glycosyltransferase [Bacteroidia bacterium]NNF83331.1 glycosyltransferase [Flavobacteriaceae bacterium]NNL79153.1 glycosyltransferase [Flavobacteriaceae bacterium]
MIKPENISFIIPVYNRPEEIRELLESMHAMEGPKSFEIVIVEDGSDISCEPIIQAFKEELQIKYLSKPNSGPGNSRNYGMKRAKGNYFIILDSDCILPKHYLITVIDELNSDFVHCFGGPDAAHESFSRIQKAIDFSMTSFITTGGIRGSERSKRSFQPRSFNMGLSKEAFEMSGGFGVIHPGEDPDLVLRLEKAGYTTQLISKAYVYHKRRISWSKFYHQVYKFGMVRAILNRWHPKSKRLTYWFPTVFILGLVVAIAAFFMGYQLLLTLYGLYFLLVLLFSWNKTGNIYIGVLSMVAVFIQFVGYGTGFLRSNMSLKFSRKKEEELFPQLFFKHS